MYIRKIKWNQNEKWNKKPTSQIMKSNHQEKFQTPTCKMQKKYLVYSDGIPDFSCGLGRILAMMCNISTCIVMTSITSICNGCNLCNCNFKVQCVVYCCALICFHNLIKLHECDAYVVEQFC